MRTLLLPVLAASLAVGAFAAPAAAADAAADAATCGATLTADSYLATDLTCTTGLTLADGVTLDLRGHRLIGPGPAAGAGITVAEGGTAAVTDGRIQGWGQGIAGQFAGADVDRVTFAGNGAGVELLWTLSLTVDGSRFTDNDTGLYSYNGPATVTGSSFARNDVAVAGAENGPLDVVDSTLTDNGTGVTADYFRITRTTIRHGSQGVVGSGSVTDSVIAHQQTGLVPPGTFTGGVVVTGTRFVGNRTALPIQAFGARVTVGSSTFVDNVTAVTVGPDAESVQVRLEGNTITRNGDGVVGTAVPTVELKANTVNRNIGWGINLPGAVDLGGNTAQGNGRSPQCVGVICP